MSRAQALSLLRQCSASLSPRTVARHSHSIRPVARRAAARHFATQNTPEDAEQKENASEPNNATASGSGEGTATEQPPVESETEKKLKLKEQEVVDLTVCQSTSLLLCDV